VIALPPLDSGGVTTRVKPPTIGVSLLIDGALGAVALAVALNVSVVE
jgi:hypothetical protein